MRTSWLASSSSSSFHSWLSSPNFLRSIASLMIKRTIPVCHELLDCLEDTMINRVLRFIALLQLAFCDEQGMITTFDDVQFIRGADFFADGCQHLQRAERITSPLHKKNRRR